MPEYNETVERLPGMIGQYATGGNVFVGKPFEYPSDPVYAQILKAIVLTCVDLVFVSPEGKILLGKRTREPQPDWWIFGGRMRPGQSFEDAAIYNMQREIGITVSPDQLSFLGVYNYIWANNAQAGKSGGSHTVSVTLVCTVTAGQIAAMKFGDEYSQVQWIFPEDVIGAPDGAYHPAVVQTILDFVVAR